MYWCYWGADFSLCLCARVLMGCEAVSKSFSCLTRQEVLKEWKNAGTKLSYILCLFSSALPALQRYWNASSSLHKRLWWVSVEVSDKSDALALAPNKSCLSHVCLQWHGAPSGKWNGKRTAGLSLSRSVVSTGRNPRSLSPGGWGYAAGLDKSRCLFNVG